MTSKFFKISSANRDNYSSTNASDFTLSIDSYGLHGAYKLVSVFMSNSYYTFTANNNKIMFKVNDSVYTGIIPPGFYDSESIPTVVATAFNTASSLASFACTFDSITQKLTINNNSSVFQLLFGSLLANSAAKYLGFDDKDSDLLNIHIASKMMNLDSLLSYNFSIENSEPETTVFNSSLNNIQSQSTFNYTFSVPNISNPLTYFLWEPPVQSKVYVQFPYVTSRLRIRVLDDLAHPIELQADYELILEKC